MVWIRLSWQEKEQWLGFVLSVMNSVS